MKLADWPPTADDVIAQLPLEETTLVEFKRDWHDRESKQGKAEFVKDVLALANSAAQDQPAYLIVGISDSRQGREIVGVEHSPTTEQLHQILTAYTNPVPSLDLAKLPAEGVDLDIVRLRWNESQPFYAIRDFKGILDTRFVFVRRGPTVGFLRPAELESMLRSKDNPVRLGGSHPIHVGFVEDGHEYGRVILRLVNLTEMPIEGISILWDMEHPQGEFFY